jgi:hypothetical protein
MCIISNKVFYGNSVEQPPEELELNKQANVQILEQLHTQLRYLTRHVRILKVTSVL